MDNKKTGWGIWILFWATLFLAFLPFSNINAAEIDASKMSDQGDFVLSEEKFAQDHVLVEYEGLKAAELSAERWFLQTEAWFEDFEAKVQKGLPFAEVAGRDLALHKR